jgi:hypothetical protein
MGKREENLKFQKHTSLLYKRVNTASDHSTNHDNTKTQTLNPPVSHRLNVESREGRHNAYTETPKT